MIVYWLTPDGVQKLETFEAKFKIGMCKDADICYRWRPLFKRWEFTVNTIWIPVESYMPKEILLMHHLEN